MQVRREKYAIIVLFRTKCQDFDISHLLPVSNLFQIILLQTQPHRHLLDRQLMSQ